MLSLRLPDELDRRLTSLAKRTGRTKASHVREAIETRIDEFEAFYLAEKHLRLSGTATLSSETGKD